MKQHRTSRACTETRAVKGDPGNDGLLLARIAGGDLACFDVLVDRYKSRVFRFIRVRVGDWHTAHDLSQETFLRLFRAARSNSYQGRASVSTWLFTIARNCTTDYLRSKKVQQTAYPEHGYDGMDTHVTDNPGPQELASANEQIRRARKLLNNLPEIQREVIELKFWAGLTFRQISELTGRPLTTVQSQLSYALIRLGRAMPDLKGESS